MELTNCGVGNGLEGQAWKASQLTLCLWHDSRPVIMRLSELQFPLYPGVSTPTLIPQAMGIWVFALIVHTLMLSGHRYGTFNSFQNPSLVILPSD